MPFRSWGEEELHRFSSHYDLVNASHSTSVVERSDRMCNVFHLDPCSRSGYLRRECQVCGIEVSSGGRVGGRA